jgi:hypothetical protein
MSKYCSYNGSGLRVQGFEIIQSNCTLLFLFYYHDKRKLNMNDCYTWMGCLPVTFCDAILPEACNRLLILPFGGKANDLNSELDF